MGGSTLAANSLNSLRVATADLSEGGERACMHTETSYENVGVSHAVNCINCGEMLYEEAHVDENSDMCCDECGGNISNLAPSQGEGYVESKITVSGSVKISIKTKIQKRLSMENVDSRFLRARPGLGKMLHLQSYLRRSPE